MLPALTAAFTAGLVLGSSVSYFPISVSCLLVLIAVGITLCERGDRAVRRRTTTLFACMLIGMLYWSGMVERTSRAFPLLLDSEDVQEASGRIIAPVQQAPDRSVMVIEPDTPGTASDQPRRIQLTWRAPERILFEGDRIRFRSRLRRPSGSLNPGGFDYGSYLERQGIAAVASVAGSAGVEFMESGKTHSWWAIWNQFDRWRGNIRLAAIQSLSQPALGIFLGIILGDRGYLAPELREQFMVTGTVHLLSISGSHLGLVAVLTFVVVRRTLLCLPAAWLLGLSRKMTPTRFAALLTVVPVTVYACLAGAELATMRSLLMVLVALLARWLGYEQRIFHALALAAAIILLHDPQAIYDISFQLSFLSVLAIAAWLARSAFDEEGPQAVGNLIFQGMRWGRDAVLMSAVVTLATLPLVAFYFNQFPWLGVIANLVAVPLMGLVLVPTGLCAGFWQLIESGAMLPFAAVLERMIQAFIYGLSLMATIPGGEWHVASPSVPLILVFYGCVCLLWLKSESITIRSFSGVAAAMLVIWWGWSPRLALDGDRFRATFLDVAQGDSAVLELPDGMVVLIDGGAAFERFDMGRGVVAPYLWNRGIRSIDHVIATHPQLDHVGGLAWVLKHFPVGHYWGSGNARDEPFYHRLQQVLAQRGLSEQVAQEGQDVLFSDGCRLSIENPPALALRIVQPRRGRREGQSLNNDSVVTRLTCGGLSMLFAADVEQDALARMLAQHQEPVDLLKVPHHGALSSLNREWIASLRPRYAVISVGRYNPYGHPAAPVLETYEGQGVQVFRTDRDGGVWITGNRSEAAFQVHTTHAYSIRPAGSWYVWSAEKANWQRLWHQWRARI